MYITLKYTVSAALILGGVLTLYWGRRRMNPFYGPWSLFLILYGVFEIVNALENTNKTIELYRILQITQALAFMMLFIASLEQSMLVPKRASRIIGVSLGLLALYFVVIPLNVTLTEFRDLTILIYNVIPTDIYGFIYFFFMLMCALLMINVFVRYAKLASIAKKRRLRVKQYVTLLVILMLIAFACLVAVRRRLQEMDLPSFNLADILFSFVVVSVISIYQSQSMSHGIETILIVDKEGNPLLGYSPISSRRISFEEKIIAASGYLSGLFHFVHDYIATTSKEVFRELKTTSSTLSFHSSEKVFMIIQTKIASRLLEKTTNSVLKELDEYLIDFQANQMPSENQIDHIINVLEKNFYLIA
ncbi:MAG: hypothetical protein ACXABK_01535 [Candidatus Heimdallarchaeaceae archaeon]|jgi:hypothetical protein